MRKNNKALIWVRSRVQFQKRNPRFKSFTNKMHWKNAWMLWKQRAKAARQKLGLARANRPPRGWTRKENQDYLNFQKRQDPKFKRNY